ncbi:MAG: hypothetical protein PVG14_18345, partial [Anaerolineales bacterium]
RTVRGGREWKPGYDDGIEALSEETESNGSASSKSQAPFPDPTSGPGIQRQKQGKTMMSGTRWIHVRASPGRSARSR